MTEVETLDLVKQEKEAALDDLELPKCLECGYELYQLGSKHTDKNGKVLECSWRYYCKICGWKDKEVHHDPSKFITGFEKVEG